jgi:hypothetical protein
LKERKKAFFSVAILFLCLALIAPADNLHSEEGNCALVVPGVNPGAGCDNVGDTCTGKWGSGTCGNLQHPLSSVVWCVCVPPGGVPPDEQETAQKMSTTDDLGDPPYALHFTVDQGAPENVATIHVSDRMGGGDFDVTGFSGSIDVLVQEHPHPDSVNLTVLSLQTTVPSFQLSDGRETGVNEITLFPDTYCGGAASIIDGGFRWVIVTEVTNDLFPSSNSIMGLGEGYGTFDFATKTVSYSSMGLDVYVLQPNIPTLSEWGMIALALLLLLIGTIVVVRMRRAAVSKAT